MCRPGHWTEVSSSLILHKLTQVASILFCGAADLALAFAGVETGGLEFEAFDLLGGRDVGVIIDRLGILQPVVEEAADFDAPAFGLGLDLVFVADVDGAGCLGGIAVELYLPFVAGVGRLGACLEETDGPEIFVETEFFC